MTKLENKILLIITGLTVLCVVVWITLYYYTKTKAENIADLKQELRLLEDKEINSATAESLLRRTADRRSLLDDYFYTEDTAVNLIERIETIASLASVSLEFSDVKTEAGLKLNFSSSGSFSNIQRFLNLIENGPFLSQFTKLDLQERTIIDEKGAQLKDWIADISLTILSFNGN